MKFFIETNQVEEIRRAAAMGALDGVCILADSAPWDSIPLREICALLSGPVIVEMRADGVKGMLEESRLLRKISKNLVPLLPIGPEGLEAVRTLAGEGGDVGAGPCRDAGQALLAAKAGTSLLIVDADRPGLVTDVVNLYQNYGLATEILAASLRRPGQLLDAARSAADAAALSPGLLAELISAGSPDRPEEDLT